MVGKGRKRGRPVEDQITEVQKRTLKELSTFIDWMGYPPTMSELGEKLGITSASAHNLVKQLERKGFVRREARKARSLSVVIRDPIHSVETEVPVTLLGEIKAGPAMLAVENQLGQVMVNKNITRGGRCFALRVNGDSMIDAGIRDGDYVIVRQQPIAESGEIIVAIIDDESTLKRLYISDERIELRPANKEYSPIVVRPDSDFRVLGKVISVTRHEVE